ncbi:hypothetical protein IWW37_004743 [Coemansia sp. RSA 2050]|nr:hypothetical protein IWW37_004743 [Coemansia sp. RSA 2050]
MTGWVFIKSYHSKKGVLATAVVAESTTLGQVVSDVVTLVIRIASDMLKPHITVAVHDLVESASDQVLVSDRIANLVDAAIAVPVVVPLGQTVNAVLRISLDNNSGATAGAAGTLIGLIDSLVNGSQLGTLVRLPRARQRARVAPRITGTKVRLLHRQQPSAGHISKCLLF